MLRVSQPAVSRMIGQLERDLGFALREGQLQGRRNVAYSELELQGWNLESLSDGSVSPQQMISQEVAFDKLLRLRSWSSRRLKRLLFAARVNGLVKKASPNGFRLTANGAEESTRVARNHRLWEMYLITYADIAPSHVDRDADQIEHILQPELIDELDALLSQQYPQMAMPPSPHALSE